jgi:hypothetical protein
MEVQFMAIYPKNLNGRIRKRNFLNLTVDTNEYRLVSFTTVNYWKIFKSQKFGWPKGSFRKAPMIFCSFILFTACIYNQFSFRICIHET